MAQIIKEITVDVAKKNLFQAIVAKQHDSNSRFLKVSFTNEGEPITISSGSSVIINAERADNESKSFAGSVNDDGTVTVPLTNWMLELDDFLRCDISIVAGDESKLTSTSFTVEVEAAANAEDIDISEDENYDILITLLADCAEVKEGCITATNSANTAATLANEKATLAQEKADLADEKAALAGANATAAETAANRANTAADNLNSVMEEANTSLSEMETATQNAEQASANANTAATNADNANADASQATREAIAATNAANEAADKANASATAADNATADAVAATNAANTATGEAQKATTDAETATANANTATSNANTAADAANDAADRVGDMLQAQNVSYDNSDSGLDAGDVKAAVDELAKKIGGVANIVVESWEDVQKIVRMGLASNTFAIGDQLTCQRGSTTLVWDIIGIDHDTPTDKNFKHSLTLQLHDCLLSLQYDATEALFYAENELPAGTYNFTLLAGYDTTYGGGKTYSFTLAKPVPAGGVIMFPWGYQKQAADTKISTYGSVTSTTVIESVAVTEGANGTALETVGECNHTHRIRYGSNNWMQSAMRQYLNSDAAAGSVWTPKTNFDRPPSWATNTAGFLNGLDADFLAVIGEVDKITTLNTLTDGGGSETNAEKFFLLSRSEVYGGKENGILEGDAYPYYSETSDLSAAGTGADTNRIKYRNGAAQYWWLRSPYTSNSNYVRYVDTTGNVSNYTAFNSIGVAPACCII